MPSFSHVATAILASTAALFAAIQPAQALPTNSSDGAVDHLIEARGLASASFQYSYGGECCTPTAEGMTTCTDGSGSVNLRATAVTGNSYSVSLGAPGPDYPAGFDGSRHCDKPGIICWSATTSSDWAGNVCVYYANTQSCAGFTVNHKSAPFCHLDASIYQTMSG